MDYKQKYEQLAKLIKDLYPFMSDYCKEKTEGMIPELKESEDERIRKVLVDFFKDYIKNTSMYLENVDVHAILAWLEKQSEFIDEEKVLIGARKGVAVSIMNFLDRNTLGMCLSNMECKDLEDAVVNSDWSKVYNYMKKKLEKQGEQKSIDYTVELEKCKNNPLYFYDKYVKIKQKPTEWSEEDEQQMKSCLDFLDNISCGDDSELNDCRNWLKSLEQRMKGE